MKTFYLLKPDMLEDTYYLEKYFEMIKNNDFIKSCDLLVIKNFVEVALRMYDTFKKTNKDEIVLWRKKMLITILGYYHYYNNKPALLHRIDVKKEDLQKLEILKKDYRKKYVYNREKYYIYIKNEDNIDYNINMERINLSKIEASFIKVSQGKEEPDNIYKLILFNKIHCSDPNRESVEHDLSIIEEKAKILKHCEGRII